jgi:aminoglycoside N3'-acetyltransferase
MNGILEQIEQIRSMVCPGRVLVHSDMFRVRAAVRHCTNSEHMLSSHVDLLSILVSQERLVFPTFNYDFLRTGVYDVQLDASQLGPFSEYCRVHWAHWRSLTPVFNVCGKSKAFKTQCGAAVIDPFGDDSIFAELYNEFGNIVLYGADYSSVTALHYIERKTGGPAYRYDKYFSGTVINNESHEQTSLNYHCRPFGHKLEYDFVRMEADLVREGISNEVRLPGFHMRLIDFHSMVDYMCESIKHDPLYMLDKNSCQWVSEKLNLLGRRFEITDFEAGIV